jgi:hypothetical protein
MGKKGSAFSNMNQSITLNMHKARSGGKRKLSAHFSLDESDLAPL